MMTASWDADHKTPVMYQLSRKLHGHDVLRTFGTLQRAVGPPKSTLALSRSSVNMQSARALIIALMVASTSGGSQCHAASLAS